jgi:uncharacterized SAM-binding protein YcdF (DUF218 family)
VLEPRLTNRIRPAIADAIVGTLTAVGAHVLGVPQLLRIPDLALFLPAAIVGAAIGGTRLRSLLWVPAGVVSALCLIVAYTSLVSILARPLIRRDSLPPKVDAIAVLSEGITEDGLMRDATLDRFLTGLSLAREGIANVLLVSREHRASHGTFVSDSADLQHIAALAPFEGQIIFVDSVVTTRTEALRMRAVARGHGWTTLAVVTSPMHTKRACATFEAVRLKTVCVPAVLRQSGLNADSNPEDRLRAFRSWLYETFASASYRSRGWTR